MNAAIGKTLVKRMCEDGITVSLYSWISCQDLLVKSKQEAERSREAQKMDLTGTEKIVNTLKCCETRELQQLSVGIGFTEDDSERGGREKM